MILKKDTILIVGAGNMGFAFISALLDNKISPKQINIIEKKPTLKLKKISKAKKINLFKSIDELNIKTKISITLIAIKPNQLDSLFTQDFNSKTKNSILISIVAGKTMGTLKKLSGNNKDIARAMTNTPVTVGFGTSIIYFSKTTTKTNKNKATHLLNLVGQVDEIKNEKHIDTFTALFGSGPAYLYLLIEIWTDLAKKYGLKNSEEMVIQTMLGSLLLLLKTQDSPKSLRAGVTSKGGTTEAALAEFTKNNNLQKLFKTAVSKAIKRAGTLSKS
ncbi:MAG: pyrroline-5-carboxylate reductase [Candidatus Pelagibacterales bacterium]|nr:pyrroline-5-carboxylate reductase [Pelagibacterales bacterium]